MRSPSYGTIVGAAFVAGLLAFFWVLVTRAPDADGRAASAGRRLAPGVGLARPQNDPESLEMWLATHPEDADRWLALGKLREERGQHDRAYAAWKRAREASEARIAAGRALPNAWYTLGWAHRRLGEQEPAQIAWAEAERLYAEAARGDTAGNGGSLYNLACVRALIGDVDGAIEALDDAVESGWNDREHTRRDQDLESLREDDRFKALLERMGERPILIRG